MKTIRKELLEQMTEAPRSISSLARELGVTRGAVEDDLRHALRSAEAAGYTIEIVAARCRACGFTFDTRKLTKPGKCPSCRGTRLFEPQIIVHPPSR